MFTTQRQALFLPHPTKIAFIGFDLTGQKKALLCSGNYLTEPLEQYDDTPSLHPDQLGRGSCRGARDKMFQQPLPYPDGHPALSWEDHSLNVTLSGLA